MSVAELEAGFAFPGLVEAPDVAEFGGVGVVGDEPEGAADIGGAELGVVADEEEFGAGLVGFAGEGCELHGAGHRGFVDDDELVAAELPSVSFGVGARELCGDPLMTTPATGSSRRPRAARSSSPIHRLSLVGGDANGFVDPFGDVVRGETEGVGQNGCGSG